MRNAVLVLLLSLGACAKPAAVRPPELSVGPGVALDAAVLRETDAQLASLLEHYRWFHQNPEVSLKEEKTAARFAAEVRAAGWTVTEGIGGFGVVAVLKNGDGPTVLARIDTDGLPVKEETGLPYASTNGAMHACGHDVHLAAGIGLARVLVALRERWAGTVVLVGQPAEEVGLGAVRMLADPKFHAAVPSKPVACLGLHDSPAFAAGSVAVCPGWASANADTIDIKIFGRGGHGAWPHQTIDPIVLAAEMILGFQTIVSRRVPPTQPAVITVGSIHGGTKHNIVPDEVTLQITVRSYEDAVRDTLLAEIRRVAEKTAEAHRAPRAPEIKMEPNYFPAGWHDPALTERMKGVFARLLGADRVHAATAAMGAEDFGRFGRHYGVPSLQFNVGGAPAGVSSGPGLHSSKWAPVPEPTVRTAVAALSAGVLDLLKPR
jgi:hippurate hydrolase